MLLLVYAIDTNNDDDIDAVSVAEMMDCHGLVEYVGVQPLSCMSFKIAGRSEKAQNVKD